MLQSCKISKQTANFIACKIALFDLNNLVCDAIIEMYGEYNVDAAQNNYSKKSNKLLSEIDKFITYSIEDHIYCNDFDKI